jgi:hypothetical protein
MRTLVDVAIVVSKKKLKLISFLPPEDTGPMLANVAASR